ncbi:MAG: Peptidoglycan glycosyltransferase [Candidatus Pacebacteria bacterium GW2011_GWA1_46_10]|nr:MAG: Peptidoglycan glycosyltransferase [Candidatus Pacebacteria bacterium GW2011_GWA1_46_10]HCR81621.1 hypothetical protein [Candidatus Paceibacterota bacterium]
MANDKRQTFINFLKITALLSLGLLLVRVVDLQVVRGQLFRLISEENRQFRLDIPAERGVFLDRFGDPLVINTRQYYRYTEPLKLFSVTTPVSQEEALSAQVSDPFSIGWTLERKYVRPFSLAHLLGYISVVNNDDLSEDSSLKMTDLVGRMGLEQRYDNLLRGTDGYQEFEINSVGEKQTVEFSQPPKVGQPVKTTIDPYLSSAAWRAMGDKKGAVVILDAQTGAVLTLLSSPSFNSNLFASTSILEEQERQTALQQALTDERQLFFNRAMSGQYAPGSMFKLVTASAGLDSGAFDLNTLVDDQGFIEAGGTQFANWYYTQYGRVEGVISLVRAITRSNDTFFYKAAEWTGVEALVQKAHEFGFGESTGIEVPGEAVGLVPNPEWKEKTLGERWFLGNTYHLGIGQGDLLVTPVQLARMVSVFGNEGAICELSVVAPENRAAAAARCGSLGLTEQAVAAIQEGMIGACSAGGTAFPLFDWNSARQGQLENQLRDESSPQSADVSPVSLSPISLSPAERIRRGMAACKTGTAEFGSEDAQGRRRTHAWFGMVIGGINDLIQADLAAIAKTEDAEVVEATTSAMVTDETALDLNQERQRWLRKVKAADLPETLTILVLVESDDEQPFREGSADAAPVARAILDWLVGRPTPP